MQNVTHIAAPAGEVYWRYEVPKNKGATMLLLTIGRTLAKGPWHGRLGEFYIAWCPMPTRDKERERELFG